VNLGNLCASVNANKCSSHKYRAMHRRLLILICSLLVTACGTVTRWPATALHCDNDDFCHAIQQDRIHCRDAALAVLDGMNVEKWHQQCACTILSYNYSPSAIAIVYDPVIEITDDNAIRRVVACFTNTHAIVLSPRTTTNEIAADADCRQRIHESCALLLTAIAAARTNPHY
jgi:hypothetical protein